MGTIKYLIILLITVLFTFFLTYYIMNANQELKNEHHVINKATEIKKETQKKYILTRKMSITKDDIDYQYNLKFYGETLSNNTKTITAEVYIKEQFSGEYIYLNNISNDDTYQNIIKVYDEKYNMKNILYTIDNYIVLQLDKYEDSKKTNLIMYNIDNEIIDMKTYKYVSTCKKEQINKHFINSITYENNALYYFNLSPDNLLLEEYKIIPTINGFISTNISTLNYNEFCV